MCFDKIERELLDGEIWSLGHQTKLPDHLQLLVDQQLIKRDIWELHHQTQALKTTYLRYEKNYPC